MMLKIYQRCMLTSGLNAAYAAPAYRKPAVFSNKRIILAQFTA